MVSECFNNIFVTTCPSSGGVDDFKILDMLNQVLARHTIELRKKARGWFGKAEFRFRYLRTDVKGTVPNLVKKGVTEVQPSLKIPTTGLGSFSLGSKNRALPFPDWMDCHLKETNRHMEAMLTPIRISGISLMVSKLTPFLLSVALRDRQLRSFAHFTP
ncbi:hypothetical protein PIB30_087607 [Stylosanthes scabra]|uniref:Uncharacterized protein n=1 Tax=Stylosanthes scabra TaxID=79078 RepID=A0ABU6QU96_9FABA|nr:hypothetical protein [Stylosanthes scabra]